MPVNTFRPWCLPTGDSTALGTPSEVMVTSCPPATSSSKAESLALAARTGMESPTPGSAMASRNSIACGLISGYLIVVFVFMAPM